MARQTEKSAGRIKEVAWRSIARAGPARFETAKQTSAPLPEVRVLEQDIE